MPAAILELVRARDWWQYKLAPAFALLVATALVERTPLLPLWPAAALLLVALAVCAAYVSVLNDLADRADDVAAGKSNRQLGYANKPVFALLGYAIAAGLAIAWCWRDEPWLVAAYAGSWVVFTLYSVPPFRLKARGLAGAVCDAMGAHLFPALTAVLVVAASQFQKPDRMWLAAAAVWSFAYGFRGIIWHQLADMEADARCGIRTFAVCRPELAVRLVAFVSFPAELLALTSLLWRIGQLLPLVALGYYAAVLVARTRSGMTLIIIRPKPGNISVLQEYYDVFLPIALLLCAVERDWHAVVLLGAFIALFPKGLRRVVRDSRMMALMLRDAVRAQRARMQSS